MLKISFDFDGTIFGIRPEQKQLVTLFKLMYKSGLFNLFILTSNYQKVFENSQIHRDYLWDILGFPMEGIIFTEGKPKHNFIDRFNIDLHFDDDAYEVYEINSRCQSGRAILVDTEDINNYLEKFLIKVN